MSPQHELTPDDWPREALAMVDVVRRESSGLLPVEPLAQALAAIPPEVVAFAKTRADAQREIVEWFVSGHGSGVTANEAVARRLRERFLL